MRTLNEYIVAIYGDTLSTNVANSNEELADVVGAWLNQDEVRDLLQAAWDPALAIKRVDHGVIEVPMPNDETGGYDVVRSRDLLVEVQLRGELHGMATAMHPEREPDEHLWHLLEVGLRNRLIDKALGR